MDSNVFCRSRLYHVLEEFPYADGNEKVLAEAFDKVARAVFFSGCFVVNRGRADEFRIEIMCIEFYYNEVSGRIHDVKKLIRDFRQDIFPLGSLLPHNYGIDVNFDDNEHRRYRASFLIRGYRKIQGSDVYENNVKSITWNAQDLWYDMFGRADFLEGGKVSVEWVDNGEDYGNVVLPEPQTRIFRTPDRVFDPRWRYSRYTQEYCRCRKPVALLIGHDPALQNSDTVAGYSLFADYYFMNDSDGSAAFKKKKGLAESALNQVVDVSCGKIRPEEIYVTNLCNELLPNPPGKTVYIPEDKAELGVKRIMEILERNPSIKYVFPMSCQVNYWLVRYRLYDAPGFLEMAAPDSKGVEADIPYYMQSKTGAFLRVCGEIFKYRKHYVIPILHAKNFPLGSRFMAYEEKYIKIRDFFKLQDGV